MKCIVEISEWEVKAKALIESSPDDITLENLDDLVNQSKEFKYSIELVNDIQNKLDLIEWKETATSILEKFERSKDNLEENMDNDSPHKTKSKSAKKTNILEDINNLMNDAQKVIY